MPVGVFVHSFPTFEAESPLTLCSGVFITSALNTVFCSFQLTEAVS